MNSTRNTKKFIIGLFVSAIVMTIILASPVTSNANPTMDTTADAAVTTDTYTDPLTQLYNAMLTRQTAFSIYCNNPDEIASKLADESLFFEASTIDSPNTSDDFDYLYQNVDEYTVSSSNNCLNVTIKWSEDANQLQQVNAKVNEIIAETGVKNMNNAYDIAKTLHDYVVKVTNYDYSLSKYTAYNALFDKKTVCQGYSLLYYKLLTEAGVSSKIILGTAEGGYHSWVIVKIGDLYYNVDPTWDDTETSSISYDYFLKGSNSFDRDHTREAKFTTEEFNSKYPTSKSNFSKSSYTGNDLNQPVTSVPQSNETVQNEDAPLQQDASVQNTESSLSNDTSNITNTYTEQSENSVYTQLNSSSTSNSNLVDTEMRLATSKSRVIENENGLLIQVFE